MHTREASYGLAFALLFASPAHARDPARRGPARAAIVAGGVLATVGVVLGIASIVVLAEGAARCPGLSSECYADSALYPGMGVNLAGAIGMAVGVPIMAYGYAQQAPAPVANGATFTSPQGSDGEPAPR